MFALGKKDARPDAIKLKFGTYFSESDLPAVPVVFGKAYLIKTWGMLANDAISDCVQAGGAHETMLWTAEVGQQIIFTNANMRADYLAMNPTDTTYMGGTDIGEAADYRQKVGLIDSSGKRHKIGPYVSLKAGDLNQVALAGYLMGAIGLGVQLPVSAMDQFDRAEPFDVVPGSVIEGGHYVPLVGRNSLGNYLIVTWGRLTAVTPRWIAAYMDEGIAYLSLERLRNGISPQGFDEAKLTADLDALQSA